MPYFDKPKTLPSQDRFTGNAVMMDDDHQSVHAGLAYAVSNVVETVADNGTVLIEINTPSDSFIHFKRIELTADRYPWKYELIEAPTLTTGTTELTPQNRLRPSGLTCACTFKSDPTGISGGTVVDPPFFFGGGNAVGGVSSSASRSNSLEMVLKKGTTYLIRCTNLSGSAALGASIWFYFYEEGND